MFSMKMSEWMDSLLGTILILALGIGVPILIKAGATTKDSLVVLYLALFFMWLISGEGK